MAENGLDPLHHPRELGGHILFKWAIKAVSNKICLHSVRWGVSHWEPVTYTNISYLDISYFKEHLKLRRKCTEQ